MIANSLIIRRWRRRTALSVVGTLPRSVNLLLHSIRLRRRSSSIIGIVVHPSLHLRLSPLSSHSMHVYDAPTLSILTALLSKWLVFIFIGEFGDYVPGMEETRKETETAEKDVYEGVGRADSTFYPDWERWKEDGEEAEEDVARTHGEFESDVRLCEGVVDNGFVFRMVRLCEVEGEVIGYVLVGASQVP